MGTSGSVTVGLAPVNAASLLLAERVRTAIVPASTTGSDRVGKCQRQEHQQREHGRRRAVLRDNARHRHQPQPATQPDQRPTRTQPSGGAPRRSAHPEAIGGPRRPTPRGPPAKRPARRLPATTSSTRAESSARPWTNTGSARAAHHRAIRAATAATLRVPATTSPAAGVDESGEQRSPRHRRGRRSTAAAAPGAAGPRGRRRRRRPRRVRRRGADRAARAPGGPARRTPAARCSASIRSAASWETSRSRYRKTGRASPNARTPTMAASRYRNGGCSGGTGDQPGGGGRQGHPGGDRQGAEPDARSGSSGAVGLGEGGRARPRPRPRRCGRTPR